MTFSALTIVLVAAISGVCFALGWIARRASSSGREDELKRNVYEAKGAIPQLESTLRNRDQRINMLQTESQSLRDRLTRLESNLTAKDAEIVKRDRDLRLVRSELQIVKDGSIGLDVDPALMGDTDLDGEPSPGVDPKLIADMKKLEARYEALKRGLIQRDDRIAELEAAQHGEKTSAAGRILEEELAVVEEAAESAKTTLAARDATIRELQARLDHDLEQRELLEALTKRRGDANRTLKDNYAKLESQLPKLMETLESRSAVIAARDERIAALEVDLARVRDEKTQRDATIVALETAAASARKQIAQQTSNHLTLKQQQLALEQRLDALTRENAQTATALESAQTVLRERDTTVTAHSVRVHAQDAKLHEQGNTVAALQKALKDRDTKIAALTAETADLDGKLNAAREAAEQAVARLAQQEAHAAQPPVSVSASDDTASASQLSEYAAGIAERDARLRQNAAQLIERAGLIASLQKTLEARAADVDALRAQLVAAKAAASVVETATAPHPPPPTGANEGDEPEHSPESTATPLEQKVLRRQLGELEARCATLTGLVRGKDATLTERARRIEDLQEQLARVEARVDERNQQITELKRMRDEAAAFNASRNLSANHVPGHPKPQ